MLMSGQDYRESLRRYHPQVFVNGQPTAAVIGVGTTAGARPADR
jgi:hypothetical protein